MKRATESSIIDDISHNQSTKIVVDGSNNKTGMTTARDQHNNI